MGLPSSRSGPGWARAPSLALGALACLGSLQVAGGSAPSAQDEGAFRERAARWAERNGVELAEAEGVDPLLERGFLRVEFGILELLVSPAAFRDPAWRAILAAVGEDLVDLQATWAAWSAVDPAPGPRLARLKPAAKRLSTWIHSWAEAELAPGPLPSRNLLDLLPGGAPVRDAQDELRQGLAPEPGPSSAGRTTGRGARLVLLTTRAEFVEFAAALALVHADHRPAFWAAGPELWTEFTFGTDVALALEFASPRAPEDYRLSIPMTARNPRGLREHVAVIAAASLLDAVYAGRLEPLLAGALANVLVIELFGELDTRSDGDLCARITPGRSVFVPGGKPRGGRLPPQRADSRWRAVQGKDHFVGVLAASQAEGGAGGEERWERISAFALRDDAGAATAVVHAPFFGPDATEPPEEPFEGDYLEFLRAYRVAFLDWLRERAVPGANEAHRCFALLLQGLSQGDAELLAAFERVYNRPLSAADARSLEGSLEGEFLAWLSRR